MKRLLLFILGFVYIAAFFLSLVIFIKPGAAIFYKKSPIEISSIHSKDNYYKVNFKFNDEIYNAATTLFMEDQEILNSASRRAVKSGISSTSAIDSISNNQISILFNPSTPSDPAKNSHTYSIYMRPYLISRSSGAIASLIFMFGFLVFLSVSLSDSQNRKLLFKSPFGFITLWVDGFVIRSMGNFFAHRAPLIKQAGTSIVLTAFFYTFMEWIFLVTKSSFMDIFSLGEKVKILLVSGLLISLLVLLILPLIFLLDITFSPLLHSFHKYIYFVPTAFLITSLCLILLDNFTYTIFTYGIVNSQSIFRALYAIAFVIAFIGILYKFSVTTQNLENNKANLFLFRTATVLVTISLIVAGVTFKSNSNTNSLVTQNTDIETKPNIIFLNTDGLSADNMSAYGYERDTTPFISELAEISLLSQNNFSNAGASRGSETSTLTGKLPLFTRVLITSNTLQDLNKYQHLPGLLKRNGYRTVSLGVKSYVDVNAINFQNAFDEVNCEENLNNTMSGYAFDDEIYLLDTFVERIGDRLKHIFFIQQMQNPYSLVTNAMTSNLSDDSRMHCLYSYLDDSIQSGQPLFAHIHLMATHGPQFNPLSQVFSGDEKQDKEWMTDFYDDAVLDFDTKVQQLVQYLQDNDLYDNTILVVYTDHGQRWTTTTRIPLIIHFPNNAHTGIITENTQNLDITPTILDYLGMPQPEWMTGSSLLEPIDKYRLIMAFRAVKNEDPSGNVVTDEASIPPFYQFGSVSMIQCQNITVFDLQHTSVTTSTVKNYPNPCDTNTLYSEDVLHEKLGEVLIQAGFELPESW